MERIYVQNLPYQHRCTWTSQSLERMELASAVESYHFTSGRLASCTIPNHDEDADVDSQQASLKRFAEGSPPQYPLHAYTCNTYMRCRIIPKCTNVITSIQS